MSIEELIGNLLLQNNCVIVPSFGGFVAKQVSARVDFETGKMFPPSKSLLFNKQLINNDGLLIHEFAKANDLSFDSASIEVGEKVTTWNQQLIRGGRIELDRIGFLYNDAENNLCFEQDRFYNLLLESFGLGQVHFLTETDVQITKQKVIKEELEPVIIPFVPEETKSLPINKEETPDLTPVIEHPAITRNRTKVWKYVAAACFLPIAFYSFWIPMKTDVLQSGLLSIKDFNPFNKTVEAKYERPTETNNLVTPVQNNSSFDEVVEGLPENVSVYTYKYDDALFIPVKVAETTIIPSDIEPINSESFDVDAMHYIVGCFGQKSNATNLVSKLQAAGLDAKIIDFHNGLHRVSAGSAISLESFSQIKTTASGLGFNGWTLK